MPPTGTGIVLSSLGPRAREPSARWAGAVSAGSHLVVVFAAVRLMGASVVHTPAPVAVVFRRPPKPPPPEERPRETAQGGRRGVTLPKAVAPDIQPELELSFPSAPDPDTLHTPGTGLVGSFGNANAGWSDGTAFGMEIRHSKARDPHELNSGWDCDFPGGVEQGRVVVRIRVHVSAAGVPTRVGILRPGPAAFNASAMECALRQQFRPALDIEGRPCEGDRDVSILFFRMGSEEPYQPSAEPAPAPSSAAGPAGAPPDVPMLLDPSRPPPPTSSG